MKLTPKQNLLLYTCKFIAFAVDLLITLQLLIQLPLDLINYIVDYIRKNTLTKLVYWLLTFRNYLLDKYDTGIIFCKLRE